MKSSSLPTIHAVRIRRLSIQIRPRQVRLAIGACIALVIVVVLALICGEPLIPVGRALDVITGGGLAYDRVIILDYRANRTAVAALAGAALGCSGALMQTVTRNPLASPDILGITSGASVGAVAVIVLHGGPPADPWSVPLGAMLGGLMIALAIAAVSSGLDPLRLVLAGIALAALCGAAVTFLLSYVDGDTAHTAMTWLAGSLNGRGPEHIWPVLIGLIAACLALIPMLPAIGLLPLGSAKSVTMGASSTRTERPLLLISVILASLATAAIGPIGFVAFVAPQIARGIARAPAPPLVSSAAIGAVLIVGADTAARAVIPWTAPIGAVTSALGAPLLIYYLWRSTRV